MKIYLIGMPGSGKTTLGHKLAEKLALPFIDLDAEIEKKENSTVREIFSRKGEDYFRQSESSTLAEWSAHPLDFVMSTGGGTPCFFNGIDTMNQTGITIFLDVEIEELIRRLRTKTDRPLLKNDSVDELKERIAQLYEKRGPIYRKASVVVSSPTVEKVMAVLKIRM